MPYVRKSEYLNLIVAGSRMSSLLHTLAQKLESPYANPNIQNILKDWDNARRASEATHEG